MAAGMNQVATIIAPSAICPVCRRKALPLWLVVADDGEHTGCASCLSHYAPINGALTFNTASDGGAVPSRAAV